MQLAALVLVAFLAADIGLVHLHRAREQALLRLPAPADAMRQMPGRLLRDAQVAVQLHARDALQRGGQQVDRDGPHLVAQLAVRHHAAGAHREALVAAAAAVGHGGMGRAGEHVAGIGGRPASALRRTIPRQWDHRGTGEQPRLKRFLSETIYRDLFVAFQTSNLLDLGYQKVTGKSTDNSNISIYISTDKSARIGAFGTQVYNSLNE